MKKNNFISMHKIFIMLLTAVCAPLCIPIALIIAGFIVLVIGFLCSSAAIFFTILTIALGMIGLPFLFFTIMAFAIFIIQRFLKNAARMESEISQQPTLKERLQREFSSASVFMKKLRLKLDGMLEVKFSTFAKYSNFDIY